MQQLLRSLFYLFVATVPWQTVYFLRTVYFHGEKWQYGTIGIYLTDIFLCGFVLGVLWYHRAHVLHRLWQKPSALTMVSGFFVGYVFSTALWASDPLLAVYYGGEVFLAVAVIYASRFVQIDVVTTVMVFTMSLVLQAGVGLWQFVAQDTFANTLLGITHHEVSVPGTAVIASDGRWLRAYGGQSHPNIFGGFMAIGLVLSLGFAMSRRQKQRIFFAGSSSILFYGLLSSFSRSAFLATVVGIGILGYVLWKQQLQFKKLFSMVVGLLVIGGSIFYAVNAPLYSARVVHLTSYEHANISERKNQVAEALSHIARHPLGGSGAGNYTIASMQRDEVRQPPWRYQPVHNSGLLLMAELGIVGSALLFLAVVLFLRTIVIHDVSREGTNNFYQSVLYTACVVFVVMALFDHWQWDNHGGFLIGVLLLILLQQTTYHKTNEADICTS